jgi:alpha-tubulin suppressor-like RCC1 family protein
MDIEGTPSLKRLGEGHRWLSMGASELNVVAVRSDGTLWQWGSYLVPDPDRPGRLMRYGDFKSSWETPQQIGTDTDWATVSVSTRSLALKRDGSLWGWGLETEGRLAEYVAEPIRLDDATNWICISGSIAANSDCEVWILTASLTNKVLLSDSGNVWEELILDGRGLLARNEQDEIWDLQPWLGEQSPRLRSPIRWKGSTGRDMILAGGLAWAINGSGQLIRWSTDPENAPQTARLPSADEFGRVGKRSDWLALDAEWGLARSVGLTADGGLWVWGVNYGEQPSHLSMPLSQRPRQVALLRTDTP